MMNNFLEANLLQVRREFYDGSKAPLLDWTITLVRLGLAPVTTYHAFRHHLLGGAISPSEVVLRDSLDEMLQFYGILEVANIAGCIPDPDYGVFWSQIRQNLSDPGISTYYDCYYPLTLPRLLRRRLAGQWKVLEHREHSSHIFFGFVSLEGSLRRRTNLGRVLRMVDSYRYWTQAGWVGLDSLVELFGRPEELVSRLLRPPAERDSLDEAVIGVGEFIEFSEQLDELLQESSGLPAIQSAIWHYYSYWLVRIGKPLLEILSGAVAQRVLGWSADDSTTNAKGAVHESMSEISERIKRLISPENGRWLVDAMESG